MPAGRLKWLDERGGEGRIEANREYPVRLDDVAPDARAAGARVQFDIARRDGVMWAVNVRLREGTRVSRSQGRFGDLKGAARPDTKGRHGQTRQAEHPERERMERPGAEGHPLKLARMWVSDLRQGDVERAILLYAPQAVVHVAGRTLEGRGAIGGYMDTFLDHVGSSQVDVAGDGADGAVIVLPRTRQGLDALTIRCRIAHGQIVEQWIDGIAA